MIGPTMESAEAVAAKRRVLIDALMMCLEKSRVMQVVDAKTVRGVLDSASARCGVKASSASSRCGRSSIAQPGSSAEDVAPPLLVFKAYEKELGVHGAHAAGAVGDPARRAGQAARCSSASSAPTSKCHRRDARAGRGRGSEKQHHQLAARRRGGRRRADASVPTGRRRGRKAAVERCWPRWRSAPLGARRRRHLGIWFARARHLGRRSTRATSPLAAAEPTGAPSAAR